MMFVGDASIIIFDKIFIISLYNYFKIKIESEKWNLTLADLNEKD